MSSYAQDGLWTTPSWRELFGRPKRPKKDRKPWDYGDFKEYLHRACPPEALAEYVDALH